MRKFTVFTVILTVLVVVIGSEYIVSEFLPNARIKTDNQEANNGELDLPSELDLSAATQTNIFGDSVNNRLGSDIDFSEEEPVISGGEIDFDELDISALDDLEVNLEGFTDEFSDVETGNFGVAADALDFEAGAVAAPVTVLLREDQVQSAGFVNAYLEQEPHDGYLYKTIVVDDLYGLDLVKYVIRDNAQLFAKAYIFKGGESSDIDEIYEVLKVRASTGLDIEINETNDFGDGSFYMNDTRRQEVAFLTVRIGSYIYGFSYPKDYHGQIVNLITLLDIDF